MVDVSTRSCGALLMGLIFASVAPNSLTAASTDGLGAVPDASAEAVAARVDELILQYLAEQDASAAPQCSDEDFLRRVFLDLTGRIPTPDDVRQFTRKPDEGKRAELIDLLLDDEGFARTWASYWREVIFSRATDVRSRRSQGVFENWLTQQLASGRPWDEIVTELLTATGDTSEDGRTALIFAHGGDPTELAAETSRIFLGIQIQCANCHDHPYDSWKREDFHELAAFFPRIRVRRSQDGENRTFLVESADNLRDNDGPPLDPEQAFRFLDGNRDGRLTPEEARRNPRFGRLLDRLIKRGDKDSDGALSRAELKDLPMRPQNQPGRGSAEYYMPDLDDPAARGTRTRPVSFLDQTSVPFGTPDVERRAALAESIVSPDNPWFARAFVNRIWAEMLGEGFHVPIDDMGPQRTAQLPEVLDTLAAGFVANRYDIRWVYRTIALTEAYQRALRSAEESGDDPAFAAQSPTRLRGDQIFNALTQALGVGRSGGRGMAGGRSMREAGGGGRGLTAALFNFDPSTPQDELMGTIPQALFMMNSPITSGALSARRGGMLTRILQESPDDEAALHEVYLRVLSRDPTAAEMDICRRHIAEVGDRFEAFEDILWSLLNSSEFLTRR